MTNVGINIIDGKRKIMKEKIDISLRNASGCYDPTAYKAIIKADKDLEKSRDEKTRIHNVICEIHKICTANGFHVEERIILRDKQTGKIWR